MKYLIKTTPLLVSLVLLSACDRPAENTTTEAAKTVEETQVIKEPALGTDVSDVVKRPEVLDGEAAQAKDYQELKWDDLLPEGYQPEKILARYQEEIDNAAEGSKEERELYAKVMGEFNNAGTNDSLSGKKVRIPGYVAPLDTNGDMVNDFLLVPYYGSCIHTPPPPAHQTVMVSPQKGVPLNSIYKPVWVVGELIVDQIDTDLATAGYQIKNASVEFYVQPAH